VVVAQLPSFVDWFGWCTWDAFYTDVTAEGVKQGLQRYKKNFYFVFCINGANSDFLHYFDLKDRC